MKLVAGSIDFPANSCAVARTMDAYRPFGVPLYYQVTWSVTCYLVSAASTPAYRQRDFSGQEFFIRRFLESSANVPWALLCDDGTPTDVYLRPDQTLRTTTGFSGIHCSNISQARDRGPEYAGQREISFTLSAKVSPGVFGNPIISFSETISVSPSAPVVDVWVGMLGSRGATIARPGRPATISQSGQAIGLTGYPQFGGEQGAPPPVIGPPAYYLASAPRFTRSSARMREGAALLEWPLAWNYELVGHGTVVAIPNQWI
jgi:hypothetical protein